MRWTEEQYQEHMRKQQLAVPDSRTEREFEATVAVMPPAEPVSGPELSLLLPWPPSTNAIWRNVDINGSPRTLLSKNGREYRKAAVASVERQNEGGIVFDGRVGVEIILRPPTRRRFDIDNRCKAALDVLVHSGVLQDDEQIDVLVVRRDDIVSSGAAFVRVWSEA